MQFQSLLAVLHQLGDFHQPLLVEVRVVQATQQLFIEYYVLPQVLKFLSYEFYFITLNSLAEELLQLEIWIFVVVRVFLVDVKKPVWTHFGLKDQLGDLLHLNVFVEGVGDQVEELVVLNLKRNAHKRLGFLDPKAENILTYHLIHAMQNLVDEVRLQRQAVKVVLTFINVENKIRLLDFHNLNQAQTKQRNS